MTNIFKDSRRDLRERAFQTLFALEFGGEALEQADRKSTRLNSSHLV